MQMAMRITAQVQPGSRIEVVAPELKEGDTVDIILLPREPDKTRRSGLQIIRSLNGHRIFRSAEEVDKYLKEERDSWDN